MTGPRNCHIELAPGCYGTPDAPVLARGLTWEQAVRRARKSDRIQAVGPDGRTFLLPPQGDPRLGRGRFGNGVRS